jgi:hypothetical protein
MSRRATKENRAVLSFVTGAPLSLEGQIDRVNNGTFVRAHGGVRQ